MVQNDVEVAVPIPSPSRSVVVVGLASGAAGGRGGGAVLPEETGADFWVGTVVGPFLIASSPFTSFRSASAIATAAGSPTYLPAASHPAACIAWMQVQVGIAGGRTRAGARRRMRGGGEGGDQ